MSKILKSGYQIKEILNKYDNFILDCDGVIYKAGKLIENSREAIKKLYDMKKKVYYLSNASDKSQEQFYKSLKSKLQIEEILMNECINAQYLTLKYIEQNKDDFSRVYLIGSESMYLGLKRLGIEVISDQGQMRMDDVEFDQKVEIIRNREKKREWVVIGESDYVDINSLNSAGVYLQDKDCGLLLTNIDEYDIINGCKYLGVGSYYNCIQGILNANRIVHIGKPSSFAFQHLQAISHNIRTDNTIMFGDRLNTDVQFAHNNHISSALLLSGVTLSQSTYQPNPTYVLPSLATLLLSS